MQAAAPGTGAGDGHTTPVSDKFFCHFIWWKFFAIREPMCHWHQELCSAYSCLRKEQSSNPFPAAEAVCRFQQGFQAENKKASRDAHRKCMQICLSNYRGWLDDVNTSSSEALLIGALMQGVLPIPLTLKFTPGAEGSQCCPCLSGVGGHGVLGTGVAAPATGSAELEPV